MVELMQKLVVTVFVFLCCYRVPSTLANNVTQDGGDGNNFPEIPSEIPGVPSLPSDTGDKVRHALNDSAYNLTRLFYESCNITSCNPVHYKHCYDDKVPQLIIHAIAILLGIVFAFFGKLE